MLAKRKRSSLHDEPETQQDSKKQKTSTSSSDNCSAVSQPPSITFEGRKLVCEKYIGRGTFGIVYIGKYGFNKVAIKFYKLSCDKPFKREIDCLVKCSDVPFVVKVLGYGKVYEDEPANSTEKNYFMISEFGGSQNLRDFLSLYQAGDLDWRVKEQIMLELLHGLAGIHKVGICHHDIKPENVLLADQGSHVCLADFGMATLDESEFRKQCKGTLQYLSPESYSNQMSQASDVWSMGVVLYELCTHGELPFMGRTEKEFKNDILKKDPEPIKPRFGVPQTWVDVILKRMLCKDPAKRATAAQVLELLGQAKITVDSNAECHRLAMEKLRMKIFSEPIGGSTRSNASAGSSNIRHTSPTASTPQPSAAQQKATPANQSQVQSSETARRPASSTLSSSATTFSMASYASQPSKPMAAPQAPAAQQNQMKPPSQPANTTGTSTQQPNSKPAATPQNSVPSQIQTTPTKKSNEGQKDLIRSLIQDTLFASAYQPTQNKKSGIAQMLNQYK